MKRMLVVVVLLLTGCGGNQTPTVAPTPESSSSFQVSTPWISQEGVIHANYQCSSGYDGMPLTWTDPPAGTQSFAFVLDDPDSDRGVLTYWIKYDLPATERQTPEEHPSDPNPPVVVGTKGKNSYGTNSFVPPCPAVNTIHGYYIRLYALDTLLNLPKGTDRATFDAAIDGHVLDKSEVLLRFKASVNKP